jgi:Major capsid protein N-terminus/Large eukaryotic DNA virus major capsid protein
MGGTTGGANIQLVYAQSGVQDTFLTQKPVFNFIKSSYKQYENFAIERINITPQDVVDFGKPITFQVKKIGQFLKKTYLAFTLPPLTPSSGTYAGWTNSIGYAIIDYIDLKINGLKVDTMYGLFMRIWYDLSKDPGYKNASDNLTGTFQNLSSLQYNALTDSNYFVELDFWYSQNISLALPLISLTQNSFIEYVVYLNDFDKCIVYDGVTPPTPVKIIDSYLATDQIFVNDQFARKFLGEKQLYIIKQHQFQFDNIIGNSKLLKLYFNHPCNQLLFVLRETESENNNDWFNFAIRTNGIAHQAVNPLLINARILLDGKPRNDFLKSNELSTLNSYTYYKSTINNYIYTMPFCNDPVISIPNGSLNFSVISDAVLNLNLVNNAPSCSVYVFTTNFNFLTIDKNYVKIEYDS